MRNFITIAKYEWKIQIKNLGFWIILALGLFIGGMDSLPTAGNMVRLDSQLLNSGYVAARLLQSVVVLMMFGFVFMTANRIGRDKKLGVTELFMASPLKKGQYVAGKFIANLCVVLLVTAIFYAINAVVHFAFNPSVFNIIPYIVVFVTVVIPIAVFTTGCSVSLPVLTDIHFVYVLMSGFFFVNITAVPDSRSIPFYLFAGEPLKLINPYLGFGERSYALMACNWLFLLGTGLIALLLLLCERRCWRER
jgi:ABC-type transport system involved in multi-copper enzyme maturation permease subunit